MADVEEVDEIYLPAPHSDVVDQDQLRGRLKRNLSQRQDRTGAWVEEGRKNIIAYEYLCHLEETKKWIEQCIGEDLPPTVELEDSLTNGIYLAKLGKHFGRDPEIQKKKIYDDDSELFNEHGLNFRHTDNINLWFQAMKSLGLPTVFIPTTIDLYDMKNMPKVIYCIHAMSHFLYKKGMANKIQDLVGVVEFTDDQISAMQAALGQYGVSMPQFGKIDGALAQELSESDAEMHAAIIAINEAILKDVPDDTLLALQIPAAGLERVDPLYKTSYQSQLCRELLLKGKRMSNSLANDMDDVYTQLMSKEEIQQNLNRTNFNHAISAINGAVRDGLVDETLHTLSNPLAKIKQVKAQNSAAYQEALASAQCVKAMTQPAAARPEYEGEYEGRKIPAKEHPHHGDLNSKEIQDTVQRCNRKAAQAAFLADHAEDIGRLQTFMRTYLAQRQFYFMKKARALKAEREREKKALFAVREAGRARAACKIQRWYRTEAQRIKSQHHERDLRVREANARILQSWVKAMQKKRHFDLLTKSNAPPLATIREFLHLLLASDEDLADDLELQMLNSEVVQNIRENQRLEQELALTDLKIGLLVKNRISLAEAVAQSKNLRKRQKQRGMAAGPMTTLNREDRERLANYQNLFYLLQTQPTYLAKLSFLLPPTAATKFVENVVLSVYNYAQNDREEYLLLKLFQCAIAEEIGKVDDIKEFATGQQLVIRMVVSYNRGVRDRRFLRELFGPLVAEVLESSESINVNPLDIYKKWISQMEAETGTASELPFDVDVATALSHEHVSKVFYERLDIIMETTEKFVDAIVGSAERLPYGIKAVAQDLRVGLTNKFPTSPSDDVSKVIGQLIFFRYMNPAIVSPDAFDVLPTAPPTLITQEQRRNLGEFSKVLQLIASNKRFDEEGQPHLLSLNMFIAKSYPRMKEFFLQASTVASPEEHFNIDQYSDLTLLNKPSVFLPGKEIIGLHRLLLENVDELCPTENDPLRQTLNDFGELSNQGQAGQTTWGDTEVRLQLTPRLNLPGQDDAQARALFVKTKGLVIRVIECQPGKDLPTVLHTKATAAQEARHAEHVQTLKNLESKIFENDNKSKTPEGIRLLLDQSLGTLDEIKAIVLRDMELLEKAGLVTEESGYQEMLNAIAKNIKNQASQRQQRAKEIEKLRDTLASLQEKQGYFDEQTRYYVSYVQQCMENMSSGQKSRTSLQRVFSLKARAAQEGTLKVTAKKLYKGGILLGVSGVAQNMYAAIDFVLSSPKSGLFQIEGFVGGRKEDEVEIALADLLQLQYEGVQVHSIPPLKINVNLMIHFLNKKFYANGQ